MKSALRTVLQATVLAAALALACGGGPAPAPGNTTPVLGVSGTRLTVDGRPRFLTVASYFDGVRRARAGRVDEDLGFLARHVDGVRVLPNWWASTCPLRSGDDTLIALDGSIRESTWRALEHLLDAAVAARLVVDISFTRETVTDNASPRRTLSPAAYEAAVLRLLAEPRFLKGRYPNVMVDVQNEWTRFADAAEIERLLARVHAADPSRLLAASVSGGRYVPTGRAIKTMVAAYHDPRDADWFTPAVVQAQVDGVRGQVAQPVYLQEPMPASAICEGQIVDTDLAHFASARLAAERAGAAAWTFHTRTTFDLSTQLLVEKFRMSPYEAERRAIESIQRAR